MKFLKTQKHFTKTYNFKTEIIMKGLCNLNTLCDLYGYETSFFQSNIDNSKGFSFYR